MNHSEKAAFALQSLLDMSQRIAEKIGTVTQGSYYTACRIPGPVFTFYDRCHLLSVPTEAEFAALLEQAGGAAIPRKICYLDGTMPDYVPSLLEQAGLQPQIRQTAMYLNLENWAPARDCSAAELWPHDDLNTWCLACSEAFGKPPETEPLFALQNDPALRLYVIRAGDKIVAAAASYITGTDCGIHEVATHPDFRRKGLCSTILTHLLQDAKELGCKSATLQASPEGRLSYLTLGMEDLGQILTFLPPMFH